MKTREKSTPAELRMQADAKPGQTPETPGALSRTAMTCVATPIRLGLIALAYFLAQMLAFKFPDSFGLVAAIWPAAGVALAALLLTPRRLWPALLAGLFAAGLAANLTTDRPFIASAGFMLANIGETAASAWLITRMCGAKVRFTRLHEVLALAAAASLVNAVTSLLGAGAASLAVGAPYWVFYRTWWVADGLGLLLVTPLLVVWADFSWRSLAGMRGGRIIESAGLFALSCTAVWFAFGWGAQVAPGEIQPYILVVFVIWSALRFGPRGTATLLGALSLLVVAFTAAGIGVFPLGGVDAPMRLLAVQIFLGMLGLAGLTLAAAFAQQKESAAGYRLLFESAGDAIFFHDDAGRMLAVNQLACERLGYSHAELMSMSTGGVDTPEQSLYVPERIAQLTQQGQLTFETAHRCKDGSSIAIEVNARRITWNGQPAIIGICRDITGRKQAEAALRESEWRFRDMLAKVKLVSATLDTLGNITFVNEYLLHLTGWRREEVLGRNWFDVFIPPEAEVRQALFQDLSEGRVPLEYENEILTRTGARRLIAWSNALLRDSHGGIAGIAGIGVDITERRRVAAALLESEQRYRNILQTTMDGFWMTDMQGQLLDVNDAYSRMSGYSVQELLAMHVADLDVGPAASDIATRIHKVIEQGGDRFESQHRRKNGSMYDVAISIQYRPADGGRLVGFLQDTTARKRNEAELQKMDKLQSIGTLAGGIAHDFNNILTGLYGNIALAKEILDEGHPSHAPLGDAEKSMSRAVRLTSQLLTFAKGGGPVKAAVSLGAMVEEVARFDLVGSKVSLVCQKAEDLWSVAADKGQLQQVITNLVINARQAMPEGGTLQVILENAAISAAAMPGLPPGNYVKVRVRDEGLGIEPQNLEKIFDPYFTTKPDGRGLGLATIYSIIHKHGGHIGVVSELGKGTTFTLHLPASASPLPAEAKPPAAVCQPAAKTVKILVMDDEQEIHGIVTKMLARGGYSVATASGGQEAIARYQQAREAGAPFDVVIMDLTIPGGIGGQAAIKILLALDPEARVIVSSGYADDPVMANPVNYGFKGAVPKPYTKKDLCEVITRVLT
ncbi:MAG: PAS domain S-box protein [bacterium]|nr:PAS domain S-box protein [bacterium]